MELKDKVAVVTGVSKGIGLSVAHTLLDKGMKVAGWSRTKPPLEHPNFTFYPVDLRSFAAVEQTFEATLQDFGSIAVLINNAGIGYAGKLDEMPVSKWIEMFDLNVHALFFCSKLVIPVMKKLKEGHIINIASVAALEGKETGLAIVVVNMLYAESPRACTKKFGILALKLPVFSWCCKYSLF